MPISGQAIALTVSAVALLVTIGTIPTCAQYAKADVVALQNKQLDTRLTRIETKLDALSDYLLVQAAGTNRVRRRDE